MAIHKGTYILKEEGASYAYICLLIIIFLIVPVPHHLIPGIDDQHRLTKKKKNVFLFFGANFPLPKKTKMNFFCCCLLVVEKETFGFASSSPRHGDPFQRDTRSLFLNFFFVRIKWVSPSFMFSFH